MPTLLEKKLEILTNTDPESNAESAGLHYISEQELSIKRIRKGKGFSYIDDKGNRISDVKILEKINGLVIPPAWEDVKITPDKKGHIQATGKDTKGRKQYLYHSEWEVIRNQTKFYRMIKFGQMLPLIRQKVEEDLRRKKLSREKVLALIVMLLENTLIRIGNTEYAKKNKSYGLTTLLDKHFRVEDGIPKLIFKGKSGKEWNVHIEDKRIAKIIKQCQDLPGQNLFQYIDDDGSHRSLTSTEVNQYLKEITGEDFTAKDFRTWGASVLALTEFCRLGPIEGEKLLKKNILNVVREASRALTNTISICKKYYIHPQIIESYTDGTIFDIVEKTKVPEDDSIFSLSAEEIALLNLLKQRLKQDEI